MIIRYFKDYIDGINEGLLNTYPGNLVLDDILKHLSLMKLNVRGEFSDNKIKLSILNFNLIPLNQINNIFDTIDTLVINRGGWFPSTVSMNRLSGLKKIDKYNFNYIINNHDDFDSITIEYESGKDKEDIDIPNKLYHLTIKEYLNKINKFGLSPKSKSKLTSHLDRIYVCKTIEDCKDLIPKMMFYYTGEKDENIYKLGKKLFDKDIEPIIYEIDNSSRFIKNLYIDVNYKDKGFYILDNIPPDMIKIVK